MCMSRNSAAIYLRISRDPKADGLANERQREDCEKIAQMHEWPVVEVYEDTASASSRNVTRMSYERMRRDFNAGKFNVLICWDLDRLTRQPRQLEDWIDAAEERGLRVVTANGEADLSTDGGRMFARVKAAVARSEIERKSTRQRRKNQQLAESGRPAPGRRKYGYEMDGVTIRESEAETIRLIAKMLLGGETLRGVIVELERRGIPSPRSSSWSHASVKHLIIRERTAGILVSQGVTYEHSEIQPILDMDTWLTIRAILTDPSRTTAPGRPSAHWLSGILVCQCGAYMTGKNVHNGKGGITPSYVCRATQRTAYAGRHATITTAAAEHAGVSALYFALARLQAGGGEVVEIAIARKALAEVDEQLARAEEAYTLTGSSSSRSLLARLGEERKAADDALQTALGSLGSQQILNATRNAAAPGERLNMDSLAAFARSIPRLSVDRKRTLAKMSMRGHLRTGTGKGAKRITWTTPDGQPLFDD